MAKPEREALDHVFAPVRAAVRKYECQPAILVGHNAHVDLNFLNAAVARVAPKRNLFHPFSVFDTVPRSQEHRLGNECGRTCSSRGSPYNRKQNETLEKT